MRFLQNPITRALHSAEAVTVCRCGVGIGDLGEPTVTLYLPLGLEATVFVRIFWKLTFVGTFPSG